MTTQDNRGKRDKITLTTLQEPFTHVIVMRRTKKIRGRGQCMALGCGFVTDVFDPLGLARPFVEPGDVVTAPILEAQPDAVDLVDLAAAPRRAAQRDQQPVRPSIVSRKVRESEFAFRQLGAGH